MSAIGSVIDLSTFEFAHRVIQQSGNRVAVRLPHYPITQLPAALGHSRDIAFECELSEAQTAQAELPHVRSRPAAQMASVAQPNLELRFFLFFRNLGSRGHFVILVRL
jgi:hypothetical protein